MLNIFQSGFHMMFKYVFATLEFDMMITQLLTNVFYNMAILHKNDFYYTLYALFRDLNLRNPIYQSTSTYGHFGREGFTWENPKPLVE